MNTKGDFDVTSTQRELAALCVVFANYLSIATVKSGSSVRYIGDGTLLYSRQVPGLFFHGA